MASKRSPQREALSRLDKAVVKTLDRIAALRNELDEAQRLNEGLVGLLESFQSGEQDPAQMSGRIEQLSRENVELRGRLDAGRASVERLLAKVRFLEDQS